MSRSDFITEIYSKLFNAFGPQRWWPGETPFEVMVGAILTQNTNWGNVEKAIANLKLRGVLTPHAMRRLSHEDLAELIRPAGYFNIKANRLHHFLTYFVDTYGGDVTRMRDKSLATLREELLAVKGIGPETADSILLYALDQPSFVIDAYTHRVLSRHFLITEEADYTEMQETMTSALSDVIARGDRPEAIQYYNEYHALLVRVGKEFCKPKPQCENCPLNGVNWDSKK
ncbi:MAG: endonuclease [Deltaproteobacteria bacterium CG11_big_fil_rev_8_21_14_0_20_47_16]|nr:MAG: endonuclease [Deltaproteobacteria bacterium CG11_big_fil_rev_8_21_14_0_20_47_16]